MASLSPSETRADVESSYAEVDQADISLLHRLVEIQSLSGAEDAAAGFLVGQMAERGFRSERDKAGNAVGIIGSGDRHVVLLGHIDTVPGRIPVRIEDGVLWGRGAVDAKGPLATFVAAASRAADRLNATVTVVGAVGEETMGSAGASEVATWDTPDFCIIGEPSAWDAVCLGYRGTLSLQYTLRRDSRHTAGPGGSVGEEAIAFWQRTTEDIDRMNLGVAGDFGRIGYSLRAFNTAGDGLSDIARLSIGLRLPPGREVEELVDQQRELAGEAEIAVDGYQLAYRTDKRSRLVPPFLRAIRAEGGTPRFTLKLGTSDMTVVGPVWGCPIVAYGPGDASLDHTPDERIVLDDYLRAVRVLENVLVAL
ncbi:MAG: [LysW]-lysine hydrolase [Thermomicrobiales bacterium]